jgi:hypothetical protein
MAVCIGKFRRLLRENHFGLLRRYRRLVSSATRDCHVPLPSELSLDSETPSSFVSTYMARNCVRARGCQIRRE